MPVFSPKRMSYFAVVFWCKERHVISEAMHGNLEQCADSKTENNYKMSGLSHSQTKPVLSDSFSSVQME